MRVPYYLRAVRDFSAQYKNEALVINLRWLSARHQGVVESGRALR